MGRDYLAEIVSRKRREIRRRHAHERAVWSDPPAIEPRGRSAAARLRRGGAASPRIVAEVKFRSPSAGALRSRAVGEVAHVARRYEQGGAAAISVLADAPGFGGCPLDVRRVADSVHVPVLFKEFVLDPVQVRLARRLGASFVLLLVRLLDDAMLKRLVDEVHAQGLEPVVEAANEEELERAIDTGATVIGVNARDLATFKLDSAAAERALERAPSDRIGVLMSGITSAEDLQRAARGRADAVLVGEGLMRAGDPGARLAEWLQLVGGESR